MVFDLKWGILATGGIAETFTRDLLIAPEKRGTTDVTHTVTAVGSSSKKSSAESFIDRLQIPSPVTAYGSYEEVVKDPAVQAVYIGSPHSHHYQHAMLALHAGKHVLCEKALTINAAQAKRLFELAKQKGLFFMEAVWTRFFPLSIQVRELIQNGAIGEVLRVVSDLSIGVHPETEWSLDHRMVNKDLAGGALLDLGIYSLTWVFQILYHTLPRSQRKPPISHCLAYVTLPGNGTSTAVAMTAFRVGTDPDGHGSAGPSIKIQGTKGHIHVFGPAFAPQWYRVIPSSQPNEPTTVQDVHMPVPEGRGMFWEADEVARCLRDGKLESEGLPWEESLVIMEVLDEVRRQGGTDLLRES
ncbi:hypothetical protein N7468_002294 [Penicillium chermesinum]|uniref:D-xylose 1-dehydrogenase (NADP(+), D-xylono-1,5-lactone-forming) n=1 Tax=Penicillium chermesinum TaxID=63820 RepID=A0A9W9TXD9_9EURO|nr:uncharacterized protein N7468_002294 [Penicillium chermesinum]KAJ5247311.1 hypothetical protein N7468_002294 [Penicillium chermesinum]